MEKIDRSIERHLNPLSSAATKELERAFDKLWSLIEAFKIEGQELVLISRHPAFRWEIRLKKPQILENLKNLKITNIKVLVK